MRYLICVLIFSFLGHANASPIEIERTDGSLLRFYFERPSLDKYPIVFILQGSTCASVLPLVKMVSSVMAKQAAVIGLEKYDINETTTECPQSYIENNTIDVRIQDHLTVLAYLRANETHWNNIVGWAGGSEGGQVVALTAPLVPETKAMVMLASGGGMTMAEELPMAITRSLKRSKADSKVIDQAMADLYSHYKLIKESPTSNQEWLSGGKTARNTYKWWNSILWRKALPLLERSPIPMYLAHGTEDTSCPVESSDRVAMRFQALGKGNLTYKRYDGLEHNWSDLSGKDHLQEVLGEAFMWMSKNLK